MEPRIQYATTKDGVSIAYWAMGQGPTLVEPPPAMPFSHIGLEWQIPEWRHFYEHMMKQFTIVRYDGRGTGLSDLDAQDASLEAQIADLEAVVEAQRVEKLSLMGFYYSGPVSIAYAAKHPDLLSHLILWCSFSNPLAVRDTSGADEALRALMDVDWALFTQTLAHRVYGWSQGEEANRLAVYLQQATTPAMAKKAWDANSCIDVTDLLPSVQTPTLIMHRRQFPLLDLSVAKALVAAIPKAQLTVLDGESLSPYVGDMEAVLRAIDTFVGGDGSMVRDAQHVAASGGGPTFRTIMFTDMEGSTGITQRLGDAAAQEMVRRHNAAVRDALHTYGGTEVKHTGDGIMASFPSATLAVECAIDIQRRLAHTEDSDGIHVRIGINAGEPVEEGGDLFGTAVQLASRVCARAGPHQILVTDVVRQLVAGKGFLFADRGEPELRGFEDPVRLFEVSWRDDRS